MRKRKRGVPSLIGWTLSLLLVVCMAALTACGGSSYAKSAQEPSAQAGPPSPPSIEERGDAPEAEAPAYGMGATTAPAAPAPGGGMPAPELSPAKLAENDQRSTLPPTPPGGDARGTRPNDPAIASDAVPIQQVLIYTAQVRMAVFEVAKALDEVEALARSLGGFLSRRTNNEITIRVPTAQFDDALSGIAKKGDVLTRDVQVEDVTEEYLDVTLRLKNARQVRERIAQLLANAKNVEESLQVEQELNRLSAEIERLEGRLKYLSNRARYSTITITFQPEQADDVPDQAFQLPFPWLRELGLGRLMNLR